MDTELEGQKKNRTLFVRPPPPTAATTPLPQENEKKTRTPTDLHTYIDYGAVPDAEEASCQEGGQVVSQPPHQVDPSVVPDGLLPN